MYYDKQDDNNKKTIFRKKRGQTQLTSLMDRKREPSIFLCNQIAGFV